MTAPVIDLESIRLARGAHDSPEEGTCLLEAVAFVAGEPHTDHPACASPILGAFGRSLNDVLPTEKRQDLKPLIPSILGTANQPEKDQARGLMAADWIIRTYTPAWLRLAGATAEADTLAGLPELRSWDQVGAAQPAIDAARAARDAAWDAARAAARDAAIGLVVHDLISTDHYNTLTRPWRTVIGPIHPDDAN